MPTFGSTNVPTRASRGDGLSVIIPAAGRGRRMKAAGAKALVELRDGQTVLGRQLRILRNRFPLADIVVIVGHDADRVCKTLPPWVRVVENELHGETNVSRSIDLGLKACVTDKVLVVYGDLVFNEATLRKIPYEASTVLVDSSGQIADDEVGVTVVNGEVTRFAYGLGRKWAHIAFMTGHELYLLRKCLADRDGRRRFGFEVLNEVLERGGELLAYEPPSMRIAEIDCNRDIERAGRIVVGSAGR